ncbi:MAG: hypothetical protein ABFD62_12910 [Syntrophaceae bacterium]
MDLKVFMADKNYEKQRSVFMGLKWLLKATLKEAIAPALACVHVLTGGRIAATNGHFAFIMNGVQGLDIEPGVYKPFFYRGIIALVGMEELTPYNFDKHIEPPSEETRISDEKYFNRDEFYHLIITKTGLPFNVDYLKDAYRNTEEAGIFFNPEKRQLLIQYRDSNSGDISFLALIMAQEKN